MPKLFASLALLGCLSLPRSLPAQDRFVIFGGYSYLRAPVTAQEQFVCTTMPCTILFPPPVTVSSTRNLNGFELTGTYRFRVFLGIAADLSGHFGSALNHTSSDVHQYTGLVGPEVSLPSRVSPFAHLLFGGTHQTVATAVGAGIDLKLMPHLWFRPIQLDYLLTRLNNSTQNQPRLSAGLVLHF
jgi:hypothetical protein